MNPFSQLVDVLIGFYVLVVLLRFFLQYFRADYHNPVSQFTVKATDIFVKPLRKFIPGYAGVDMSSLVLAYLVVLLKIIIVNLLSGLFVTNIIGLLFYSLADLSMSVLQLFWFMILVRVILSWVAPGGYSPAAAVFVQLTEPLLGKFRRMLPPMSGFDLSPMIALVLIYFLQNSISYYILPHF